MKVKSIEHIVKKVTVLMATVVLSTAAFGMTASAAELGSDTISQAVYGTTATGTLTVHDTYANAVTSYARSGSNISISATVKASFRFNGKDITISDYDNTMGGGVSAVVELSVNQYPNAVFLTAEGQHEVRNYVNGALLSSGYWLDFTRWVR